MHPPSGLTLLIGLYWFIYIYVYIVVACCCMLSRTSQDTSTDMYGSQWFGSIQLLRYFAKVVLQLMTSEH